MYECRLHHLCNQQDHPDTLSDHLEIERIPVQFRRRAIHQARC